MSELPSRRPPRGVLLLIAVGFLILTAVLAITLSPKLLTIGEKRSEAVDDPLAEVARVSLEEAKRAFGSETAIFVDVRASASYAAGHIPGALSIPLAELEQRRNELDPQAWIITYCT